MKITPLATGGGLLGSADLQTGTSQDRLAQAKSVMTGETRQAMSDTPVDPQVRRAQESIRRLKMKVNQTVNRNYEITPELIAQAQAEIAPEVDPEAPASVISDSNESGAVEEAKPISPQFAALARQRRSLQAKERELAQREQALQAKSSVDPEFLTNLKSKPLSVLQEQGVLTPEFYNQLTEFLMSGQAGINPEVQALKDEIKALREGVDKNFVDRDQAAKAQVLKEMRKEAEFIAMDGDSFRLLRESKSIPKVIDLIDRTYEATQEVLDVREAMQLVQDQLKEDYLPIAALLNPAPAQPKQELQLQPKPQQIRTLTNRDTAQMPLDRKTRAIMAAQGLLKRG